MNPPNNTGKKRRAQDKIIFSIGTKLITIISIIVIFSLGSITVLVSWMVREDLKISAEDNNFEANRRAAEEAEDTLASMRTAAGQLIYTINALKTFPGPAVSAASTNSAAAKVREAADFFFVQTPRAVAFAYTLKGTQEVLVNREYFLSRDIDPSLADTYFKDTEFSLLRAARGETVLLNAAPVFTRPVLALFFPYREQTGQSGAGGVLIASEKLIDSFGLGINQSFLINDQGDILIHSDSALIREGANVAGFDFIRAIREAPDRSRQELIHADFNFASLLAPQAEFSSQTEPELYYTAFTKLANGGCIVITGIEYDKVFEGITATTRRNIYLTAAVLFISVMFIWFFSKTISTPLRELAKAARSIEGGNFEQQLQLKGHDEIGMLGASFSKMSGALHIFGRFTNREIAIKAMRGEIKPGGLPKHATIFFSDIRDFTAISENFTKTFEDSASDKIVFWLNNYLTRMVECVEKTGGAVDKFIGDAVMAHWGTAYTDGSPKKDAFNCVKAALMMRHALMTLNRERAANDPGNPPIRIGCGINTGIVTAGQIGSNLRMEYTVIGDPVNLASRVEALTKPLAADILITENTWDLVGDTLITEEMPSVTVKGKAKPVRLFAVVNFIMVKTGPRTLAEVRKMLGVKAPDLSKVDLDAEEKKYKISGKKNGPDRE